ncbi:MAG: hypothetical protein HY824_01110 [Acidobacteria bacterium]|nr:hypothetical protein [Acidobacteriota bacterium]
MTRAFAALAVLLALTVPAGAHHSIAGTYNTSREVTVEGVVSQFHWVQPHPFVVVDVRRGGAVEQWSLEFDNRSELLAVGFTESTLKPGDRIIVAGSPAHRDGQHLYVQRLDRPADGFGLEQVGNSPRLRARPR